MKTPKKTTIEINEKEYDGDRNNLELESGDYIVYTFNHFDKCRPVVPGCAGCAMAHPDFGRLVNPISTRGDGLFLPNYYWHPRIFRPSDGLVVYSQIKKY